MKKGKKMTKLGMQNQKGEKAGSFKSYGPEPMDSNGFLQLRY